MTREVIGICVRIPLAETVPPPIALCKSIGLLASKHVIKNIDTGEYTDSMTIVPMIVPHRTH